MSRKLPSDIEQDLYALLESPPRAVCEATKAEHDNAFADRAEPLNEHEAACLSMLSDEAADWLLIRSEMDRTSVTDALWKLLEKAVNNEEHTVMAHRIRGRWAADNLIKALTLGRVTSSDLYGITKADLEPMTKKKTNADLQKSLERFWQIKEDNLEDE